MASTHLRSQKREQIPLQASLPRHLLLDPRRRPRLCQWRQACPSPTPDRRPRRACSAPAATTTATTPRSEPRRPALGERRHLRRRLTTTTPSSSVQLSQQWRRALLRPSTALSRLRRPRHPQSRHRNLPSKLRAHPLQSRCPRCPRANPPPRKDAPARRRRPQPAPPAPRPGRWHALLPRPSERYARPRPRPSQSRYSTTAIYPPTRGAEFPRPTCRHTRLCTTRVWQRTTPPTTSSWHTARRDHARHRWDALACAAESLWRTAIASKPCAAVYDTPPDHAADREPWFSKPAAAADGRILGI